MVSHKRYSKATVCSKTNILLKLKTQKEIELHRMDRKGSRMAIERNVKTTFMPLFHHTTKAPD